MEKTSKTNETAQLGIGGVMQRLLIYALIYIACFHICRIWLSTDWKLIWDILAAFGWSLNVFYLKSFRRWFLNAA